MRRTYYHFVDSLHLLKNAGSMFYMRLSNGGILGLLLSMKRSGDGYGKFLDEYPAVLCEPLDLFYLCRRGMCSLDDELLQDLLFSFSWREAYWGAWLSALSPRESHIPHLQSRVKSLPHGKKVIDLALAACGEPVNKEIEAHYLLLQEVVRLLKKLPTINFPMRRWPTVEEEFEYNAEVENLRNSLRNGGISMAKIQLNKGLLSYYGMSYAKWIEAGAPEAPNPSFNGTPSGAR